MASGAGVASGNASGRVRRVVVRVGRHVDLVQFEFENGGALSLGNSLGGEARRPFELNLRAREHIVRVRGRQNKHLDAIQFVTNLGRESEWYGGAGGEPYSFRADAGRTVVGLEMDLSSGSFCPPVKRIVEAAAPAAPPRLWLARLALQPSVRRLVFAAPEGGGASVFQDARAGQPSAMRLLLKERAIMLRVMLRGDPCFLRLMLDGEQLREPDSLFRQLCSAPGGEELQMSAMAMLSRRDPRDASGFRSRSLVQMLLQGSPSVGRQFFGKSDSKLVPLFQLLFARDVVNGYPSVTHLLMQRDVVDGAERPSVFEASLEGEQYVGLELGLGAPKLSTGMRAAAAASSRVDDAQGQGQLGGDKEQDEEQEEEEEEEEAPATAPLSLLRLMLLNQPPLLGLLLEGEREGKESILRRFVEDKDKKGASQARMVLTRIQDHRENKPALSSYLFGGEERGRPSILRLMIAGEERGNKEQLSLMRLLFFKYQPKARKGGSAPASSSPSSSGGSSPHKQHSQEKLTAIQAPPQAHHSPSPSPSPGPERPLSSEPLALGKTRRSLIDYMTAGKPSIADLFFQGELEGEDSLARLMLGTCVDFKDGYLRLGATLKAGNENGVSLFQWMLLGEEAGGPGISFLRMFLYGEEDHGESILRLLLLNEGTNEPSLLRILITALKALLVASKTRPHQLRNGEWKATADKMLKAVTSSQKEGGSVFAQIERLVEGLNPNGEQLAMLISVLREVPKRGSEFQSLWRRQWLRVADEVDRASKRAKRGSAWRTMGPMWRRMAEHLAEQRWAGLAAEFALLASNVNTISKWADHITRVHEATPRWMLPRAVHSLAGFVKQAVREDEHPVRRAKSSGV
jgi:hypothetical protein